MNRLLWTRCLTLLAGLLLRLGPAGAQGVPPTPVPGLPHFQWQNPPLTGYRLTDLCALDSLTAYAAGERGTVIKTTDGGRHWQVLNTGTRSDISSISFFDALHGWIAYTTRITRTETEPIGGPGEVRYTADGGLTWVRRPLNDNNTTDRLWSIKAQSATHAILIVEGIRCTPNQPCAGFIPSFVLRTTNAGQTWQRVGFGGGQQAQFHYLTATS